MTPDEVRQAFRKAVEILVDEDALVKGRLLIAYASQLSQIDPQHDLPMALGDEYRGVRYALSDEGMPYGYGEHAAKKLSAMTDDEASVLARTIFHLYLRLAGVEQTIVP